MSTTTTFAYRDSLEGARLRYADLVSRTREGSDLSSASRVFASRTGRICAGATGIAGAALMVLAAGVGVLTPLLFTIRPTTLLLASWPLMGAAYALGRVLGAYRVTQVAVPAETGDVHADLARLEREHPVRLARRLATRLEWASTALPMIAVGLLAPLSIHLAFRLVTGDAQSFNDWIRMSLVIVGHAHLALAFLYWRFANRVSGMSSDQLSRERSRMEWRAFGITVGISALPGAVLFLIPPVLTAVTALLFHPGLFRSMTRTIIAEREALA